MRISDWSSDVCSSDLGGRRLQRPHGQDDRRAGARRVAPSELEGAHLGGGPDEDEGAADDGVDRDRSAGAAVGGVVEVVAEHVHVRSEEHTSELQSLMRISYAVFCLKKQKNKQV